MKTSPEVVRAFTAMAELAPVDTSAEVRKGPVCSWTAVRAVVGSWCQARRVIDTAEFSRQAVRWCPGRSRPGHRAC